MHKLGCMDGKKWNQKFYLFNKKKKFNNLKEIQHQGKESWNSETSKQ